MGFPYQGRLKALKRNKLVTYFEALSIEFSYTQLVIYKDIVISVIEI